MVVLWQKNACMYGLRRCGNACMHAVFYGVVGVFSVGHRLYFGAWFVSFVESLNYIVCDVVDRVCQ